MERYIRLSTVFAFRVVPRLLIALMGLGYGLSTAANERLLWLLADSPLLTVLLSAAENARLPQSRLLRLGAAEADYGPLDIITDDYVKCLTANYYPRVASALGASITAARYPCNSSSLAASRAIQTDLLGQGSYHEAQFADMQLTQPYALNESFLIARPEGFAMGTPKEMSDGGSKVRLIYGLVNGVLMVLGLLLIATIYWYFRQQQQRHNENSSLAFFSSRLFDEITIPIAVRDRDGRFIFCNQAFYSIFGVELSHVLNRVRVTGLPSFDAIHAAELDRIYFNLIDKGVPDQRKIEGVYNGNHLSFIQLGFPYRDKSGKVDGLIMGWLDITSNMLLLKNMEALCDKAVKENEAKSRYLAMMSHEIRTHLNAIIGMLELTMRTGGNFQDFDRTFIASAYYSSNTLLGLIGEVLDIAKIESGKNKIYPAPCNPQDLLDNVVLEFQGLAREKGLKLVSECRLASFQHALLDNVRMKQVLSNLIVNAIKFTDKGQVMVRLYGEIIGDSWHFLFEIEDSGVGISAADQELLFEPFIRLSNKSGANAGTGLGLVICQKFIDLMSGTIIIDSMPGRGTIVKIELKAPVIDASINMPLALNHVFEPLNVLIVDDNPANRLLMEQQSYLLGHIVLAAEDGVQALELVEYHIFDVIITDCNMPMMDGYELTTRVRALELTRERKACSIIGFTANAQPDERQRCLAVGMDDCLFKPVSIDMLDEALKSCSVGRLPKVLPSQNYTLALDPIKFDLSIIESLMGGDEQIILLFLKKWYESNEQDLQAMDELIISGANFRQLAHRVKGAARMVGASGVVDAVNAYEDSITNSSSEDYCNINARKLRSAIVELQEDIARCMVNR